MDIKTYEEFNNDLKRIWLRLEKKINCTPFQTFDWSKNWFETIGTSDLKADLNILYVKSSDYEILFPFIIKVLLLSPNCIPSLNTHFFITKLLG